MESVLVVLVQTACAIGFGVFFSFERRCAGVEQDAYALGTAGAVAAIAGYIIATTTRAPAFDYLAVMGAISFASAILGRDLVQALVLARNPVRPAQVDTIALACTIWAGTACAIGDIRGCVLVVLVMSLTAVCRVQTAEPQPEQIAGEKFGLMPASETIAAVDTSVLARAPSVADVFGGEPRQSAAAIGYEPEYSSEGGLAPSVASVVQRHPVTGNVSSRNEVSATAHQLKLLAQALRAPPAQSGSRLQLSGATYSRRSHRIPDHNVAARQSSKPEAYSGSRTGSRSVFQPAG